MDWQQVVSLGIVAVTALLLIRSEVKKRRSPYRAPCGMAKDCPMMMVMSLPRTPAAAPTSRRAPRET